MSKKPGRPPIPSKLTPERQDRIVSAVKAGNYLETAARFAGIDPSTLHGWMAKGRTEVASRDNGHDPDPMQDVYVNLLEAVEGAKAEAEVRAVAMIQRAAADGTWSAAAWYLERSAPYRWGRFQRAEVSGPEGGPINVSGSGEEALLAALERFINDDSDDGTQVDGRGSEPDA